MQQISKQQLVQYFKTLALLEQRRKEEPWKFFQPHQKQKIIHNAPEKEIWAIGGNRSGKTEILIVDLVKILLGVHPSRTLKKAPGKSWSIWVCTENRTVQRDTVERKLWTYLPPRYIRMNKNRPVLFTDRGAVTYMELEDPDNPNNPMNGTSVTFKTYDSDVNTFESASIDACFCDEEPPQEHYEAIQFRLVDTRKIGNGYFQCAMTPTKGLTWSFDEIVEKEDEDPDIKVVNMSMYDNIAVIGEENIKKLESKMSPHVRAARIYGEYSAREGKVLDNFINLYAPMGNLIEYDEFLPKIVKIVDGKRQFNFDEYTPYESIDYGYRNPTAVGFYAVDRDGVVYKFHEIYLTQTDIPTIKGYIRWVRLFYGYSEPLITYIDPSTKRVESSGNNPYSKYCRARNMDPNVKDQLEVPVFKQNPFKHGHYGNIRKNCAFAVPCKIANNDRQMGWENFNDYLHIDELTKKAKMYYTDNLKHSIIEARNLTWPEETRQNAAKEIQKKKRDHTCDENRYLLMARPTFVPNFGVKKHIKEKKYYDSVTGY